MKQFLNILSLIATTCLLSAENAEDHKWSIDFEKLAARILAEDFPKQVKHGEEATSYYVTEIPVPQSVSNTFRAHRLVYMDFAPAGFSLNDAFIYNFDLFGTRGAVDQCDFVTKFSDSGEEATYAYDLERGTARSIDVIPYRSKMNKDKPMARIGQRVLYLAIMNSTR